MVQFLDKDSAYAQIVQIVNNADRKLVLISPFIRMPDDLLQRLKYKDKQGIKTLVVCRENDYSGKDLASEVRSELKELRGLELFFDDDLHAKCFYNEKYMVITSLNLLESSQRKNREMGVLLSAEEDPDIFNDALKEAEYIIDGAKKDSPLKNLADKVLTGTKSAIDFLTENTSTRAEPSSRTKQKGYCIRCGKNIAYDLDAPYCPNCWRKWNKDPDYKEDFCHSCGNRQQTTKNKPRCAVCYSKSPKK